VGDLRSPAQDRYGAPAEGQEDLAKAAHIAHIDCMAGGWIVAAYRHGQGMQGRELWDCAIPGYADAQVAVRMACLPDKAVTRAEGHLSHGQVALLGLQVGQVRKR
jgi:hypothetical protein